MFPKEALMVNVAVAFVGIETVAAEAGITLTHVLAELCGSGSFHLRTGFDHPVPLLICMFKVRYISLAS